MDKIGNNLYLINGRKFRKESCVAKPIDMDVFSNCYYEVLGNSENIFYTPDQFFLKYSGFVDYLFFNKLIPLDNNYNVCGRLVLNTKGPEESPNIAIN